MTEPSEQKKDQPANDAEQLEIKLPGEATTPRDLGLWAGVLALLALVVYWQATNGSFLWRDDAAASSFQFVGPGGLSRIWMLRWEMPAAFTPAVYQPVALSAYWLEYQLGGHNAQGVPTPMAYHIGALVFLAVSAVLLWLVLRELKIPGSWLIAATFALHPLHTEPVSWIAEQGIVVAGLMFIGSIYTYLMFINWLDRDRAERADGKPGLDPAQTWGRFAGSVVMCILAMLAHPTATVLPAIIMLVLWWRKRLTSLDAYVLVALLLIGAVLFAKNFDLHRADESNLISAGIVAQIKAVGNAMSLSSIRLIAPVWLSTLYTDSALGFGVFAVAAVALIGLYLAQPTIGRGPFAAMAMFGLLAVASVNWFDASRLSHVTDASAYLTMLPLVILIVAWTAGAIERTKPKGPQLVVGVSAVVLIALGLPAWMRTHVFETPIALWSDTLNRHPDSVLAEASLAEAYRDQARTDAAAGYTELVEGDYKQAAEHAQAALRLDPHSAIAEEILANVFVDRGDDAGALPHFANAARLDPRNARILTEYGKALVTLSRYGEAKTVLDESLAQDVSSGLTHRLLGKAYFGLGNFGRAAKEEETALEVDPSDTAGRELLGDAQAQLGKLKEAITNYGQVMTDVTQRTRPDLWMKIARLKDREGDFDAAVQYMEPAQKLASDASLKATETGDAAQQKAAKETLAAIDTELAAEREKQRKAAATRPSTRSTTGPATTQGTVR